MTKRRRTDNTMTKRIRTKGQTMMYKSLHRKLRSSTTNPNINRVWTQVLDKGKQLILIHNIPATPAYGVYISKLIRYSRTCAQHSNYLDRAKLQRQRVLKHDYTAPRLKWSLQISTVVIIIMGVYCPYMIALLHTKLNFRPEKPTSLPCVRFI